MDHSLNHPNNTANQDPLQPGAQPETPPPQEMTLTRKEQKRPELVAGANISAIVPRNVEEAHRLGTALLKAGMTPRSYNSAEQVMVAIMKGLELGMPPLSAVQSIYVLNGIPTVWGDGALALVRASGLIEDFQERFTTEPEELATCIIKRKGEQTAIERHFSKSDAERAGLLHKKGPWQTYRQRMFQMRARSWALRDGFADVLQGLKITEEVVDHVGADLTRKADGTFEVLERVPVTNPLDDDDDDDDDEESHQDNNPADPARETP